MRTLLGLAFTILFLTCLPSLAEAQTTVTIGSPGPGTTSTHSNHTGWQTMTAPPGATTLNDVQIGATANGGPAQYTISLHRLVGGVPGPSLVTSPVQTANVGPYAMVALALPPGGVAVSHGERLAIQWTHVSGTLWVPIAPDYYPDGNMWETSDRPTLDAYFTASFTVAPAAVPTLSEWAMILLAAALAGGALWVLHRRQTA